jgi:hypothetical protein
MVTIKDLDNKIRDLIKKYSQDDYLFTILFPAIKSDAIELFDDKEVTASIETEDADLLLLYKNLVIYCAKLIRNGQSEDFIRSFIDCYIKKEDRYGDILFELFSTYKKNGKSEEAFTEALKLAKGDDKSDLFAQKYAENIINFFDDESAKEFANLYEKSYNSIIEKGRHTERYAHLFAEEYARGQNEEYCHHYANVCIRAEKSKDLISKEEKDALISHFSYEYKNHTGPFHQDDYHELVDQIIKKIIEKRAK